MCQNASAGGKRGMGHILRSLDHVTQPKIELSDFTTYNVETDIYASMPFFTCLMYFETFFLYV